MKRISPFLILFIFQALASTSRDRLKEKLKNRNEAKRILLEESKAYEIKLKINLPSIVVNDMRMEEKLKSLLNPTFVHTFDIATSEDVQAELNFEGFSVIVLRYTSSCPPPENLRELVRSQLAIKEAEKCFLENLPQVAEAKGYKAAVKRALKSILVSHKECEDFVDYERTTRSECSIQPYVQFPIMFRSPSGDNRACTLNELKFLPMDSAFALVFDIDPSQFQVTIQPSEEDKEVPQFRIFSKRQYHIMLKRSLLNCFQC